MEVIRELSQLSHNDASIAGGKGASLGEMTQSGIPVPPGFVVLSSAFNQFIHEVGITSAIDAELHKVDVRKMHTVEYASEQIKKIILNAHMPKGISQEALQAFKRLGSRFVAVR